MKILIVEDQEKLAISMKEGLENYGYSVDIALDGRIALSMLEYGYYNYDLVILDIMLPFVSGIEVCATLRSKNIMIPILMVTARDSVEHKIEGLDAGADDYVIKPFNFDELLARIRALLRRPQEITQEIITIKDISLNITTRKVSKRDVEIPLTVKEFAILEYCMRHSNQILTRDQIISHVWDHAYDAFSNVIDVHIKNLRKKLQNKHEILLETVHGVGYRLIA